MLQTIKTQLTANIATLLVPESLLLDYDISRRYAVRCSIRTLCQLSASHQSGQVGQGELLNAKNTTLPLSPKRYLVSVPHPHLSLLHFPAFRKYREISSLFKFLLSLSLSFQRWDSLVMGPYARSLGRRYKSGVAGLYHSAPCVETAGLFTPFAQSHWHRQSLEVADKHGQLAHPSRCPRTDPLLLGRQALPSRQS